MDCLRETVSIVADVAGIISLVISLITLLLTARIRKSLLSHVEASIYREDIDEQIRDLEAVHDLLLSSKAADESFPSSFFTELICKLNEIQIAYETILKRKVIKEITSLMSLTSTMESKPPDQKQISNCTKQLNTVIVELKKEKKIL